MSKGIITLKYTIRGYKQTPYIQILEILSAEANDIGAILKKNRKIGYFNTKIIKQVSQTNKVGDVMDGDEDIFDNTSSVLR